MKNIYENALFIQGACNLSGVVHQFSRDMEVICEESRKLGTGTLERNTHPVVLLYVDKLAHLCGLQSTEAPITKLSKAFDVCEKKAQEAQDNVETDVAEGV